MMDGSGIDGLADDFDAAASRVPAAASAAVRKAALDVERIAKQHAPVDTGFLQGSIGVDLSASHAEAVAKIGPTAHYGAYVEYGTWKQAEQPYMQPALDAVQPGFIAAMEQIGIEQIGG